MKRITLELDAETIERLEALGKMGSETSQGNEILGMALVEAYQKVKKAQKHKGCKKAAKAGTLKKAQDWY